MCTLSWLQSAQAIDVFFNRDEQKTRQPARNAQYWPEYQAIFPLDPQGGGTWLAVTTDGCVFALLNNYQAGETIELDPLQAQLSRGLVITMLLQELLNFLSEGDLSMPSGSRSEAITQCLDRLPLHAFRPFILVCLVADEPEKAFKWDGRSLSSFQPVSPVVSSAVDLPTAQTLRNRVYPGTDATVRQLTNFHRSHQPTPSAFSVCMHRDDAHTVSFSHLQVNPREIHFHYHAGAPCLSTASTDEPDSLSGTVDVTMPRYSDNASPKNSLSCL